MKIYTGPTHYIRDLVHFRDEMMVALYGYIYIFGYLKSGLGDGGEERPLPSLSSLVTELSLSRCVCTASGYSIGEPTANTRTSLKPSQDMVPARCFTTPWPGDQWYAGSELRYGRSYTQSRDCALGISKGPASLTAREEADSSAEAEPPNPPQSDPPLQHPAPRMSSAPSPTGWVGVREEGQRERSRARTWAHSNPLFLKSPRGFPLRRRVV